MARQMVRRDVEKKRDVGAKRRCRLQLVGGQLENDHAVRAGIGQRARGLADIAADGDRHSGSGKAMADQRGRRRFAVGAGDGDDTRLRGGPHGELDLADHRNTGRGGAARRRVRFGMLVRDSGADDHGVEPVPWPVAPVGDGGAVGEGARCLHVVVMQEAVRPAGGQGPRGGHAGQAKTEDPDPFA